MTSSNTLLEPIAVIGIACEFAGDIHRANDLWYTLKESRDAGSATTIDRFDLESFTAHMINMDNNGQFHQKLLRVGSVDPCHRLLILKFIDLLDGAGYSIDKINGTKTSVHIGQFSTDHAIAAAHDGLCVLLLKQLSDAERDGDPIEANCLDRFFNQSNLDPPLLLDLIKSNLGHTEGAAGVLSLIKVAICMYHRDITANMQFTSFSPKIDAQKYNLHILQ
ncbi:unnamed protein product, partial [Adineta steineri]